MHVNAVMSPGTSMFILWAHGHCLCVYFPLRAPSALAVTSRVWSTSGGFTVEPASLWLLVSEAPAQPGDPHSQSWKEPVLCSALICPGAQVPVQVAPHVASH